jgi:hypothetical protein
MSNLSDLDATLQETSGRAIIEVWESMRSQLRKTQQVSTEELELLVMGAYIN